MSDEKVFLAFDIGGTKIAYALIDGQGKVLQPIAKINTPRVNDEIYAALKRIADDYAERIDGVAIATAGEVDRENCRIIASVGNMPKGYMDTDFCSLSSKPVYVENDANAAIWGELYCGAAKGAKDVMLVAIGTGVGIAFVSDGKLLKGKSGAAAEAHFPINRGQVRRCSCGAWDCYEIYASGTALGIDAQEAYQDPAKTSHDIIKGIQAGDAKAKEVFERWQGDVVDGIRGLANIFDPEIIILFGSLTEFMDYRPIEAEVNRQIVGSPLKLCCAELGSYAAMVGAVLGAAQKLERNK